MPQCRGGARRGCKRLHARRYLRGVRAHRRGQPPRCLRARCCKPYRRGQRARGDHQLRQLCPGARQVQDLYHRRGPHAHDGGVQRAAQDARGAAGARDLCAVHHRPAKDSGDHPLALPALRFPPHRQRGYRASPGIRMRAGGLRLRRRGARHRGAPCQGRHARRALHAGAAERLWQRFCACGRRPLAFRRGFGPDSGRVFPRHCRSRCCRAVWAYSRAGRGR